MRGVAALTSDPTKRKPTKLPEAGLTPPPIFLLHPTPVRCYTDARKIVHWDCTGKIEKYICLKQLAKGQNTKCALFCIFAAGAKHMPKHMCFFTCRRSFAGEKPMPPGMKITFEIKSNGCPAYSKTIIVQRPAGARRYEADRVSFAPACNSTWFFGIQAGTAHASHVQELMKIAAPNGSKTTMRVRPVCENRWERVLWKIKEARGMYDVL